ncbi:MAG: thioesterase family protein [Pseudomonadota bacterium]
MFRTPITPRVAETDGAGHINNTVVPVWFEAGRRDIFRLLSPRLSFDDWHVAVATMTVDYLAQIYFAEEAEVRTWVERIGTKSFTLYEEIWQGERHCAKGTVTYVCFDYAAQRSVPVPEHVRAALTAHLRTP